jgi:DNA polymerase III delta prime subunit
MFYYEKYGPKTLDEYVWTNTETQNLLESWIKNPLDFPNLLLTGPTGTGKTSIAQIIRSSLEERADTKFIPASMRNGVEAIRNEIVNFCEAGGFLGLKLIILDEADRLSRDAQGMLRNVMDRYSDDVRFIMTCNYPEKIIDPLKQGRMWILQIESLDEELFLDRLIHILDGEDIEYDSEASMMRLSEIMTQFYPNLRGAISEVQRSSMNGVLSAPPDGARARLWEEDLLGLLPNLNMSTGRQFVASLKPDDFQHAYRILYQNSESFADLEKEAILIIADHLDRDNRSALPDITLLSCLIALDEIDKPQ